MMNIDLHCWALARLEKKLNENHYVSVVLYLSTHTPPLLLGGFLKVPCSNRLDFLVCNGSVKKIN